LTQQKVKIGGMESTQPTLSFHHNIVRLGRHGFTNLGSPLARREGLTVLDASKNAVRVIGYLFVPLFFASSIGIMSMQEKNGEKKS
jgi:hypothetical protein